MRGNAMNNQTVRGKTVKAGGGSGMLEETIKNADELLLEYEKRNRRK